MRMGIWKSYSIILFGMQLIPLVTSGIENVMLVLKGQEGVSSNQCNIIFKLIRFYAGIILVSHRLFRVFAVILCGL